MPDTISTFIFKQLISDNWRHVTEQDINKSPFCHPPFHPAQQSERESGGEPGRRGVQAKLACSAEQLLTGDNGGGGGGKFS